MDEHVSSELWSGSTYASMVTVWLMGPTRMLLTQPVVSGVKTKENWLAGSKEPLG
jgi:hypothetical protein